MLEKDESFQGASVADIGCGYQHCIAVTTCGQVFVWGSAGFSFHEPHLVHQVHPVSAVVCATRVHNPCSQPVAVALRNSLPQRRLHRRREHSKRTQQEMWRGWPEMARGHVLLLWQEMARGHVLLLFLFSYALCAEMWRA